MTNNVLTKENSENNLSKALKSRMGAANGKAVRVTPDFSAGEIVRSYCLEHNYSFKSIDCSTVNDITEFQAFMASGSAETENGIILIEHLTEAAVPGLSNMLHAILRERQNSNNVKQDIVITFSEDTTAKSVMVNRDLTGYVVYYQ